MSRISGTWFKKWLEPTPLAIRISAWAVANTRTGKIISVWEAEVDAKVCAATGHPGEYCVVRLHGAFPPTESA